IGRVRGRAEVTGRARGMQGSSGGASSLLYSAAVTVRFFDAIALALFACELGIVLLGGTNTVGAQVKDLCGARAGKPVFPQRTRFRQRFPSRGQDCGIVLRSAARQLTRKILAPSRGE